MEGSEGTHILLLRNNSSVEYFFKKKIFMCVYNHQKIDKAFHVRNILMYVCTYEDRARAYCTHFFLYLM